MHGWSAERVAVASGEATAQAQVLFRQRGPIAIAYIPRGPAFSSFENPALVTAMFDAIDAACNRRRAIQLTVEPDRPLPAEGGGNSRTFVTGGDHFQPSRTVKVPLLDDSALLDQMHQKTRYSVRLAERRGVEIRRESVTEASVATFYQLLTETSDRNEFGIHDIAYYRDFLNTFGGRALLLIAYVEESPAAGLIAGRFGNEAIYMYGASSTQHRAHGAAFALQFEAMRWARDHNCTTYDLWGIPATDPGAEHNEDGRVAGTKGDDWRGLYKFKIGFGGSIVSYPPMLERRYRPLLSYVVRRLHATRGS
jgi:peptidoglycan pentaglycine glycine transferase (the first glycine)